MLYRLLVLALLMLAAGGCGGSAVVEPPPTESPSFELALPQSRLASEVNLQPDGSEFLLSSESGVSVEGSTVMLDAAGLNLAYVVYGTEIISGFELSSITVEFAEPDTEFWLAFSDYGISNSWELHGPFSADSPLPVGLAPPPEDAPNYINGAGYTYWAVIVGQPNAVNVLSCQVGISAIPVLTRPPSGDVQVDSASSLYPDLLLVPEDGWYGAAGAPLIAYTSLAEALPELHVAYFDGAAWQHKRIDAERNLTHPQLLLTSAGFRLIAHEPATGAFRDYLLDNRLEVVETEAFAFEADPPLLVAAADVHNFGSEQDLDEEIIHASAFSSASHSELWLMAWNGSDGWHEEHAYMPFEDRITGATFRYNPVTGEPLLALSHGTFDTTDTLLIDTALKFGSRQDANWSFTDDDVTIGETNQAPLVLDLGFQDDGTPQLVAVAARDLTVLDFTASLFFDVTVGSPGDETWIFERAFESSVRVTPIFPPIPPEEAVVELTISPLASWARPDGFIHSIVDGEMTMDLATQQPTDGSVETSTQFRSKPLFAWTADDYYTGSAGIQFSFGDHHIGGGAAYIKASVLSVEDLLAGDFALENELRYWSPD